MNKFFKSLALIAIAAFGFASCEDVPSPFDLPTVGGSTENQVIEPQGDGTFDNPFNVAGVRQYIETLGADTESDQEVYVKGRVYTNETTVTTVESYGNMTFKMIDEGNTQNIFTAFQVYGPNKEKFKKVEQIKPDDEVVVCGKVVNYKGNTPETVGKGSAYVYSINGKTEMPEVGEGGGDTGSVEAIEVTCAEAVNIINSLNDGATSAETYSVTGYITDVYNTINNNQQSFWMADTKDGGKVLQAFYANLPEGVAKFTAGSKVKITGKFVKYVKNGAITPEVKNPDVEVLEEGEGGDDTGGDTGGDQGTVQHITIAKFLELADPNTVYELTGTVNNIKNTTYGNFDLVDETGSVYIYGLLDLEGKTKNFASLGIAEGDEVTLKGKYKDYNGKAEIENAQFISIKKAEGGDQGEGDKGEGEGDQTTGDGMTINDLPSNITTNAYGTQLAADESTWLTWTWNGIEFAGARICKANAIDGTIQFQGNASDVSKMGFLFNKTAWSKNISKITLVLKVKESTTGTTYDPSYSLYAGSAAHPTESAITPTSSMTTANGIRTYTQVFDLSSANAKYFTIYNNKAGALYVEKIIVE